MISKESLEILKELAETQDCSIHWNSEYNIALDEAIRELEDIKEKSADEMFEKLGYENGTGHNLGNGEKFIWYKRLNDYNKIMFYEKDKKINISGSINMQELKAINKKIKKLGW